MANYKGFICSAYGCNKPEELHKVINEYRRGFCRDHINLLDNGSTMTIIEIISNTKQDLLALKNMINFDTAGYSESEFDNTMKYLMSNGDIKHNGSILITSEDEDCCEFFGCKLKKRQNSEYCSNHKSLPPVSKVKLILESIKFHPKTSKQIAIETDVKQDRVRASLHQLVKFGYTFKEKRGVTNYYMRR